ncbi:iron(III) transport system substrate-binding protein [Natronincola peptidivorans]|uniref:Iron(III) transport system substrate-binding protein n=1 Tax=Natronincola peptidivorans TaxID=426128 RepID=A0A1I0AV64_9FIRM|nr:ABC transporter substrate-binding protein [Natronincola peptidivorans]SES98276.1 iron(III) transport system substrate-binding protein [Natronincola peptidivorans]
MFKKMSTTLSIILLITLILASCSPANPPAETADAAEEAAKQPKNLELTIYAGLMEDHAIMATREFEKQTGVKTNFIRMSSGETLARIRAEKDNMTASIWYGGPVDAYIAAIEDDLLVPYKSPNAANFPDKYKDSDGYWTGIYSGYLGFVLDKEWFEENNYDIPTSWDDLLKPEFKGQIATAHPGSSGTAYTMLATIIQLKGEEAGFDYLQRLNGQIRQYTKSGTAPGRMVGLKEIPIGITFLHDAIKYRKEGFKDIMISAPVEGTGYEIGGVAILRNGPDQEAARMFVDWTLTKEVQELGSVVDSFQFLTNPDAVPPEEAMELKDTKLIDYDFDWAGKNRRELVERFNDVTRTTPPTD